MSWPKLKNKCICTSSQNIPTTRTNARITRHAAAKDPYTEAMVGKAGLIPKVSSQLRLHVLASANRPIRLTRGTALTRDRAQITGTP